MRTKNGLLAALFISFPAWAQSAQSVCGGLLMGDERVRCMQVISGHTVEPGAANVCGGILMGSDRIACLSGTLDKRYQPSELSVCSGILMGADRANCMAAAGAAPHKVVEERRTRRRARADEENEDEDDDRPRRRDRNLRLTNYHPGTISRFYFRAPDARRFQEVELTADIGTNHYLDLSVPDQTLEICVETPDGFRLHWERVRKTEDLVIAATEPNWAVARCRDLR